MKHMFDVSPRFGFLLLSFFLLACIGIHPAAVICVIGDVYVGWFVLKFSFFILMITIALIIGIVYRIKDKRSMRKYGIESFKLPNYIVGYEKAREEHKEYCAKIDRKKKIARLRKEVGKLSKFRRFIRKILRRGRIKRYHIIHNNIIELSVPNLTGLFAILVIGVVSISFIAFILIRNI